MSDAPAVHARTADDVLAELDVRRDEGLDEEAVRQRRGAHGPNRLREPERRSALRVLADQFASTVILVLLAAAVLALLARKWTESIAIFAVLVVNASIGFASEWRARRSMQALRALARQSARVRRGGAERTIPADDLVPGDILLFEAGDVVAADARLVSGEGIRVDEAALTGESVAVTKSPEPVAEDAPLAERSDMLFRGTSVADGAGEAVVSAIGSGTELGRIAELAESAEAVETPLEKRLDRLGRRLAVATGVIVVVIAAFGLLSGRPTLLMLETAIALGVAAIPEGLPIVATLALARGMWLMARRQALINRLAAVETLGATRVIFSDKTGTLTENRMTLRSVVTAAGRWTRDADAGEEPQDLACRALEIAVLCNGASLGSGDSEAPRGDPTEIALLRAGREAGLDQVALLEERPEVREVAFDSETMMMATYHRAEKGLEVAVKGATAAVLDACDGVAGAADDRRSLDDDGRTEWTEQARALADEGLRVLAIADKVVDDEDEPPYEGLRLVGLVGLLDPPRAGVREAIEACRSAGIRVRVVTGDQAETARAIAREVGLGDGGDGIGVMEGADLPDDPDSLGDDARQRILDTDVFARLSPKQKLDLVAVFQAAGEVVAMTGDGVNDAPALKKADIGIAMGRRGTEAARQVSDMILRDDAFASIVAAVEQGRVIFGNIRKSVVFMLCTNGAEILAIGLASLAAIPLPLRPLQILYLNVLTDVLPALALGVGAGSAAVMTRPPRDPGESVLTRSHWLAVAGWSGLVAACVLAALLVAWLVLGLDALTAVTVSFLTLGLAKCWFVLNLRDPETTLADDDVVNNRWIWAAIGVCLVLLGAAVYAPGLSDVLEARALPPAALAVAFAASLVPALCGQGLRTLRRLR